jgi:hypothetical protein
MQRGRAYCHRDAADTLATGLHGLPTELRDAEWARGYHSDLRAVREKL